jgi:hypothetical protein
MKNPARRVSGAGFLVSDCALAPSARGPAPPEGEQGKQGKQLARQSGSRGEGTGACGLELHH